MRITQLLVVAAFSVSTVSTSLVAETISVDPASPTEVVGQSFTLSVDVSGVSDLYGYQFDLGFDPTILEATSVTEGPFLATGGPTIFIPGTIDNVGGSVTANADILNGPVSGVDGTGDLLDVTFQALAPGSSTVQIFNLFALNSFGQGLSPEIAGSTVAVVATPEPGYGLLLVTGMIGLLAFHRLRSSCNALFPRK